MEAVLKFAMGTLKILVPNKYVFVIATGVGWYGRQVTLTYGHDFARKIIVSRTVKFVGNERVGKFFGMYVVAPLSVPQTVSTAAYGVGAIAGVITILVLNTLCYCYDQWGGPPKSPDTPPVQKKDEEKDKKSN